MSSSLIETRKGLAITLTASVAWALAAATVLGLYLVSDLGFLDGDWPQIRFLGVFIAIALSFGIPASFVKPYLNIPKKREDLPAYFGDPELLKTPKMRMVGLPYLPADSSHPCANFWRGLVFTTLVSGLPLGILMFAVFNFGPYGGDYPPTTTSVAIRGLAMGAGFALWPAIGMHGYIKKMPRNVPPKLKEDLSV
jgi:hypothetical protein